MASTSHAHRLEAGRRVFTRILVGIDGSQQSLEAARQAALLEDPAGDLTLLAAWEDFQRGAAEESLLAARDYIADYTPATGKLIRGTPVARLLEEVERERDTLVAVGSSGLGRLRGIVEGSVATAIIHRAPCSVLVARPARDGFPRRIVVGVDGSVESAAAYVAARYLAERFDAELQALVARGGKSVNERLVAAITDGEHEETPEAPTDALRRAAEAADLVVVGSRGLHGVAAHGSVSERVARTAPCSTLVVR